jgi:hypothetical protein
MNAARGQLITQQHHHVIESDLPILTPQSHTTIFADYPRQTRSGTPKPAPQNQQRPRNTRCPSK